MRKKAYFCTVKPSHILLLCLMAAVPCAAQQVPLCIDQQTKSGISLDYNRLYDYSLYEHSRWGLGLRMNLYPKRGPIGRLSADLYGAYGVYDKQWKYGLAATEQLAGKHNGTSFVEGFSHDYQAVGSRRILNPTAEGGELLPAFLARRMTRQNRVFAAMRHSGTHTAWIVEASWTQRALLFDNHRLLYLHEGDTTPMQHLVQLRGAVRHNSGLRAEAALLRPTHGNTLTARLLADYTHTFSLRPFELKAYAQGGLTSRDAAYVDHFALGGTYSAPFYMGQVLTTARANEFTASAFILASLRLSTQRPLVDLYSATFSIGFRPRPFVGVTAVWGTLWQHDGEGRATLDGINVQAPTRGLGEAVAGIDGLVRWGAVDWGLGLAYRLVLDAAPYHLSTNADNLLLLVTARLSL